MKIRCLGGCREVGKNAFIVEGKENVLFDYGVKVETGEPPQKPGKVDSILLGHAHLDHTGTLPSLYRKDRPNLFSTVTTFDLTHLLLKDSLKIARIRGLKKYFDKGDIDKMKKREVRVTYGQRIDNKNCSFEFFDAGHIPGSMAPLLEMNGKRILYVSDFNTGSTRLLNGAKIKAKNVDILIENGTTPTIYLQKRNFSMLSGILSRTRESLLSRRSQSEEQPSF